MIRRPIVATTLLLGLASVALLPRSSAFAASKAGDAKVVVPVDNTSTPTALDHGTTATPFSLQLPAGAACRGDSANQSYRVQSYMVPSSVDPGTLQFGSVGPIPVGTAAKFRQPLFDLNTNPYVNAQTAMATHPKGPGPIINIPGFNFSVFKAGDIPSGLYNVGIACTRGPAGPSQLDTYWNTQINIAAGAGGAAGPVAWSTPGAASGPGPAKPGLPIGVANSGAGTPGTPGLAGGGAASDLSGGAAAPQPTHAVHHSNTRKPSGAPPSFSAPLVGDVRAFIPLPGSSALSVALWVIAVLIVARVTMLVLRRPYRVSSVNP